MNRRPLFLQLFYTYMPLILLGLFLLIIFVNQSIRGFYYSETQNDLRDRAQLIGYWIENNPDSLSIQSLAKNSGVHANMRVTIIDGEGKVLGDSHEDPSGMDNHSGRPEIKDALIKGEGVSQRLSTTLNEDLMYFAIPIHANKTSHVIRVSVSVSALEISIQSLERKILTIGLLIGLSLFIISYFASKLVTVPLETMRQEIERLVGNVLFSKPIPIPKTRELASVAISMNTMAEEIDSRIQMLEQEKNHRESLLSSMQSGIIAMDDEFKIISINDIAIDYLGIADKNIIGKTATDVINQKKIKRFIKKLLKKNKKLQQEITVKKNKTKYFLLSGTPFIRDEDTSGILIVINDLTLQKQLETVRQDFVSNVSHELKTPITSMIGYMEILNSGKGTKSETKMFIEKVFNQSKRLNDIVDDLLRLSRIESQEEDDSIILRNQPLLPILEGAVEDIKSDFPNENRSFIVDCKTDLNANVDSQLFREAISNLLDNGIKYGKPNSEIKITCEQNQDNIKIHLSNEGDLIPVEHKEKIFQRFYRIEKSRSREKGGTGLGLSIVKHIIIIHNGTIDVEDYKDKGTVFILNLPT